MTTLNQTMAGRDVYMRYTNANGSSFVAQHRCWGHAENFVAARHAEHSKLALEPIAQGKPPGANKAERITEDQYHAERKA